MENVLVIQEDASWLGPLVIGLGAIAAAILTAIFAQARLRRQLSENRALQREQLEIDRELRREQLEHDRDIRHKQFDHDAHLHREQLAHDREMRHRESVRDLLNEAVSRERQYRRAWQMFFGALERAEKESEDGRSLPLSAQTELQKMIVELQTRWSEVLDDEIILRTYLGNHPVVTAHENVVNTLKEMFERLEPVSLRVRSAEHRSADLETEERVEKAQASFLGALTAWNLQLDKGRSA